MKDDEKTARRVIENHQMYAYRNTEYLDRDMMASKERIYDQMATIFKNKDAFTGVMNQIERKALRPDHFAEEVAHKLENKPEDLGPLKGGLFSAESRDDVKKRAQELGKEVINFGNIVQINKEYEKQWKMAVDAQKKKPHELAERVNALNEQKGYCDAMRDNRLKDRDWSPHDERNKYLDKGLTPEEREKSRELAKSVGDEEDPFSL